VRELVAAATVVATSVLAYPEARSALARLLREGSLTETEHLQAKADLDQDWTGILALGVDGAWRHAGDLAERHGLRGADSLHLATFLALIGKREGPIVRFSSFDERLNEAARREAGEE
jgi:predicted nucleic acid-binding protein